MNKELEQRSYNFEIRAEQNEEGIGIDPVPRDGV